MAHSIKSYIDDLFDYLQAFESNPERFETEAFLQTYQGVYAVFEAFRRQRDEAIETDQYFLSKIQRVPLSASDLRQVALQVLITFFESVADIDGQSDKSYAFCRGLRDKKQDVPYFEQTLVPMLFRPGALDGSARLNGFFLDEISRYLNKFGKAIDTNLSPERFDAMTEPMKFLQLARRRHVLGATLVEDRSTLEFHLQRVNSFSKMAGASQLALHHLNKWHYLKKSSFWSKVKSFLGELAGKFVGAFSSFRYMRLVTTQRNPAYALYGFLILLFIALAVYVPMKWTKVSERKLDEFRMRADSLKAGHLPMAGNQNGSSEDK
ncbi:MAG: hypothetical protein ACE5FH_10175 [Candidatus Zixiibacteriota bacterium]